MVGVPIFSEVNSAPFWSNDDAVEEKKSNGDRKIRLKNFDITEKTWQCCCLRRLIRSRTLMRKITLSMHH